MSVFNRDRAGYSRLDKMSDLEKRLVSKLGRREPLLIFTVPLLADT
jgi:hypothetical protein